MNPGIAPDEACNRLASCIASSLDIRSETRRRSALSTFLQLLNQGFGILQVCRIKPFGEPAVDWRKKVMGFLAFPLLLPQSSQARGSTEFERFGLLALGYCYGLGKTRFRFSLIGCILL